MMKGTKKLFAVVMIVGLLGAAGFAYAAAQTPADIVSGLTGKSVEALAAERAAGKTYGTIASEAGKLEEFKAQILAQKKAILDERVTAGTLTQEQADKIYTALKEHEADCDGTCSGGAAIGKANGAGFGRGSAAGGAGLGQGQGMNRGQGARGMGRGLGAATGTGL